MPVETLPPPVGTKSIAQPLLAHYDRHARDLPWRIPPGSHERADPYRVWLSEVMLQQTTVAAVIPYFHRFTAAWPRVEALAAAAEADVMAAWAGLGYYARARNLIACARTVAREYGGRFPPTEDALRKLPGLGAYTAAAVAAIAFGERAVVVDANVERVVARLFAIAEPLPGARGAIRRAADAIAPDERSGDFAQAMMDLGAAICTPRAPRCLLCPLRAECDAFATGDPARFPIKAERKAKPHRHGTVWWLEREDGHVWIERRGDRRMLGGMAGLPGTDWDRREGTQDGRPPVPGAWTPINVPVRHGFTHFDLTLTVERLRVAAHTAPPGGGNWWPLDRIGEAGLPALFAKAARIVADADA